MGTTGYYDEIAKIERLRNDQLERLRKRVARRRRDENELSLPDSPPPRHLVRKLPGRKSWSH